MSSCFHTLKLWLCNIIFSSKSDVKLQPYVTSFGKGAYRKWGSSNIFEIMSMSWSWSRDSAAKSWVDEVATGRWVSNCHNDRRTLTFEENGSRKLLLVDGFELLIVCLHNWEVQKEGYQLTIDAFEHSWAGMIDSLGSGRKIWWKDWVLWLHIDTNRIPYWVIIVSEKLRRSCIPWSVRNYDRAN
jgi:hypothetical protein